MFRACTEPRTKEKPALKTRLSCEPMDSVVGLLTTDRCVVVCKARTANENANAGQQGSLDLLSLLASVLSAKKIENASVPILALPCLLCLFTFYFQRCVELGCSCAAVRTSRFMLLHCLLCPASEAASLNFHNKL